MSATTKFQTKEIRRGCYPATANPQNQSNAASGNETDLY